MGTAIGRNNGTTGAIPLTIFLARIFLPGVLRGLRTTSARDHDSVASVETVSPPKKSMLLSKLYSPLDLSIRFPTLDRFPLVEGALALGQSQLHLDERPLPIHLRRHQGEPPTA